MWKIQENQEITIWPLIFLHLFPSCISVHVFMWKCLQIKLNAIKFQKTHFLRGNAQVEFTFQAPCYRAKGWWKGPSRAKGWWKGWWKGPSRANGWWCQAICVLYIVLSWDNVVQSYVTFRKFDSCHRKRHVSKKM